MRLGGRWVGDEEIVTRSVPFFPVITEQRKVSVAKGGQAIWTEDRLLRPPAGERNHSSAPCTRAGKKIIQDDRQGRCTAKTSGQDETFIGNR